MNTLNHAQTRALAPQGDAHLIRAHWRGLLHSPRKHTLTAPHHLVYAALLGRDWRRGFTPPTNARKLANGGFYDWGLFHALAGLHDHRAEAALLAPFDGLITRETLVALRTLIPLRQPWNLRPEAFAGGRFPFEAYEQPATIAGGGG